MSGQDFITIGESPSPGLTLRHVLRGHSISIRRIAWSPNGDFLASSSEDNTLRIWDMTRGECIHVFRYDYIVIGVAWAPDGQRAAWGSGDGLIHIWSAATNKSFSLSDHQPRDYAKPRKSRSRERPVAEPSPDIISIAWSPDGNKLASADRNTIIRLWDTETWQSQQLSSTPPSPSASHSNRYAVFGMAWSPDGQILAAACTDGKIRMWQAETMEVHRMLESADSVTSTSRVFDDIAFSPTGQLLASASQDKTIRIWDTKTGMQLVILEGHTSYVDSVSFSADGRLLASKSHDNTMRVWRCDNWSTVAIVAEETDGKTAFYTDIAFHPQDNVLATYGEYNTAIRVWELDVDMLLSQQPAIGPVRYTTAKVVLVGDSGVGKTGLGWRLAHNEFKEHASTHGQQFWVVEDLSMRREDGTECEVVLWDLAGQHVYRAIHAIFLDDVDAALVLFDPTDRQDSLKGVKFWLEQLSGKHQVPPTVLVGARSDRGSAVISRHEIEQFCSRYNIRGGYLLTSAKTCEGVDQLVEILKYQIPWDQMTATVTTVTFKRIKAYILGLKEQSDLTSVLASWQELREQLQATDENWQFTDAEMTAAVKHLQNHGYVAILRSSAGTESILLIPDLLVDLASSIVLQADKHPHELGSLRESELLQSRYPLAELAGLTPIEQQILLDAAVTRFVNHNVCFRESLGQEPLLIFPGLIKQKRPLLEEPEVIEYMSYIVAGRTENVYAALVVLLGYTQTFTRVNQWQNQAQYELGSGEICGFRLIAEREGEIELVLYRSIAMPQYGSAQFKGLFEQFLYQRDVDVAPFPPVICHNSHQQERATVIRRVRENKTSIFCDECGTKVDLPDAEMRGLQGGTSATWIQREEALARLRSTYETYLVRVKGYRRDRAAPRCYLSCATQQAEWVGHLSQDLREAGVVVVEDVAQVIEVDVVVIVSTSAYKRAWDREDESIKDDLKLIRSRLAAPNTTPVRVIQLTLEDDILMGSSRNSSGHPANDFSDESHYCVGLFDLVLSLYAIRLDNPAFQPLREGLRSQWEQKVARFGKHALNLRGRSLNIFVSYSHEDEAFKDSLIKMLAGLQRRSIIDAWQDRQIEAGDEWRAAIHNAIDECDLALLLVSSDFLASRFIQEEELPRLLQLRKGEGMQVVPIIVRPCLWQSEPVLSDLQALPKDARAVITFSEETGERDQVWTDICGIIEARAKRIASERGR